MPEKTTGLTQQALLDKANEMIRSHKDYFPGLAADGVEQKGGLLIFQGDHFPDENGLPGTKSTVVFNVFKQLTTVLSSRYHLKDKQ